MKKHFLVKFMDLYVQVDGTLSRIAIMAARHETEEAAKSAGAALKLTQKYISVVEKEFENGRVKAD